MEMKHRQYHDLLLVDAKEYAVRSPIPDLACHFRTTERRLQCRSQRLEGRPAAESFSLTTEPPTQSFADLLPGQKAVRMSVELGQAIVDDLFLPLRDSNRVCVRREMIPKVLNVFNLLFDG